MNVTLQKFGHTGRFIGQLGVKTFNYLVLMMVDPKPNFHGIPRYRTPLAFKGYSFKLLSGPLFAS